MIRLACMACDRGDYDGTTIEKALHDGWEDISEEQTLEEACREYELGNTSPGKSIFDWFTHLGFCPSCAPDNR